MIDPILYRVTVSLPVHGRPRLPFALTQSGSILVQDDGRDVPLEVAAAYSVMAGERDEYAQLHEQWVFNRLPVLVYLLAGSVYEKTLDRQSVLWEVRERCLMPYCYLNSEGNLAVGVGPRWFDCVYQQSAALQDDDMTFVYDGTDTERRAFSISCESGTTMNAYTKWSLTEGGWQRGITDYYAIGSSQSMYA